MAHINALIAYGLFHLQDQKHLGLQSVPMRRKLVKFGDMHDERVVVNPDDFEILGVYLLSSGNLEVWHRFVNSQSAEWHDGRLYITRNSDWLIEGYDEHGNPIDTINAETLDNIERIQS